MIVGHGRTGIRSALRRMVDLEQQSGRRPHAWVEFDAWRVLVPGDWASAGGDSYEQPWSYTFKGRLLQPTSVYTENEVLARTYTSALCDATEGTYFYDASTGYVRVHLTAGEDPSVLEVFGVTTHYIWNGSKASPWLGIQPILGPNILIDGGLNDWSSATALTSWGKTLTGVGHTLNRQAALSEGTFCARFDSSGIGGGSVTIDQAVDLGTVGQLWRCSVVYKPVKVGPNATTLSLNIGTADGIATDGRNTQSGTAGNAFTQHFGSTRRHVFDFAAHEVSSTIRLALTTPAGVITSNQMDDVRLQPIYGWAYGSPRLAAHTSWEESLTEVYPGARTTGIGSVELLNGDNYFEDLLVADSAQGWHFDGSAVRVKCGGQFLNDGQEILYDDMLDAFTGRIVKVRTGDLNAGFELEEEQSILETLLPIDTYTEGTHPNASPSVWNRARPMLYGTKPNITPARIGADGTTGYGVHEYCATERWVNGVNGVNTVESLLNGDETEQKRVTLVLNKDYTDDAASGVVTLLADVRVIEITAENNILDFNIGGGALKAVIAPGVYTIGYGSATVADRRGLAEAVRAAMVAAGAPGTIQVDYSTGGAPLHKVRIDLAGKGTLNLLWQTGANAHVGIGPTLGYRGDADDTGAAAYDADDALFVSADESEILRIEATGYIDDGAGTYTGTPLNPISRGNEIMRHIWKVFLKQPEVDLDSFGNFTDPTDLGVYLGGLASVNGGQSSQVSAKEVFSALANSNAAQFQFDGAGVLYYSVRVDTAPSTAASIPATHYLAFEGYFDQTETYGTIRLNHSQDPTTGFVQGVEATRTETVKGSRRSQVRTFDTYLTNDTDADAKLPFFVAQSRGPLRHIPCVVKGRMLRTKLGDMFKLNRERGLRGQGETTLVDAEFRLKSKRTYTDHTVELLGHTSVIT